MKHVPTVLCALCSGECGEQTTERTLWSICMSDSIDSHPSTETGTLHIGLCFKS